MFFCHILRDFFKGKLLKIYWLFWKYIVKCSSEKYARLGMINYLLIIQTANLFLVLKHILKNKWKLVPGT